MLPWRTNALKRFWLKSHCSEFRDGDAYAQEVGGADADRK
jgi:hypothetical protein